MPPKKLNGPSGKTTTASQSGSSRPWPPLPKAIIPFEVVELLEDQILAIPHFLTAKECAATIAFADSHLPFQAPKPPGKDEATRTNYRWSGDGDNDVALMRAVWSRLAPALTAHGIEGKRSGEVPLGLHSNVRVYRYASSQSFEPHYDDSLLDARTGLRSGWTLLIYLSGIEDGVEGGETVFYRNTSKKSKAEEKPIVAELARGTALLHRHGSRCMLHEARPVRKGTKWVLRSDVLFGPSGRVW